LLTSTHTDEDSEQQCRADGLALEECLDRTHFGFPLSKDSDLGMD
jgi:hypothetical protein